MGALWQFLSENKPAIDTISLVIFAISAIVAARQLSATRRIHNYQYLLQTRRNTLDYSISRNPAYREARRAIEGVFGVMADREEPVTVEEVKAACAADSAVENHIRTLLSNYENLALAIRAKVADDDVARELLGASVLKTADIFMPYIEHRRQQLPSRYLNLLQLKKNWESRNPGDIEFYRLYFGNARSSKRRRIARAA